MIEALRDDELVNRMGGRFRFTSLVQHRVRELMEGSRPLVDRKGRSDLEVAILEIVEGKIAPAPEPAEPDEEPSEAEVAQ